MAEGVRAEVRVAKLDRRLLGGPRANHMAGEGWRSRLLLARSMVFAALLRTRDTGAV